MRKTRNKRQALLLGWGMASALAVLAVIGAVLMAALPSDATDPARQDTVEGLTSVLHRRIAAAEVPFRFADATEEAGIRFRHFPAVRRSLLPEDMGSGLAWGDYDGDGDPDLFLVNFRGSILDGAPRPPARRRCALYRNNGDGTFTDVTDQAGLGAAVFGMGAAWADYDNDHDLDLYITCYGPNVLYRNNGDGTFTDATDRAGVGDDGFSAGAAWADYNRDGRLDLYVCNYVDFRPSSHPPATAPDRTDPQPSSEIPFTLNPASFRPQPNVLYRNNGDGTFTDVAGRAGVANPTGRSLSAVWVDFDRDGWVDLYVANDVSDNGVYHNRGDGTFRDAGASSLAADYRGAMGLAVGDYDGNGDPDLFITHWVAQENALFHNVGRGPAAGGAEQRLAFLEVGDLVGLGQVSLDMVGWATGFADLDNDGLLDLWVVNGHTFEDPADRTRLLGQPLHLYHHRRGAGFFEAAAIAGPQSVRSIVGRGGAHADYDADGRIDLAILVHGGRAVLLRNTTPDPGHWIAVRLRQTTRNTSAIGAIVTVRAGDLRLILQVSAGGSYLSQSPTDLHFGLGERTVVDRLEVLWPDGAIDTHRAVEADRLVILEHTPSYDHPTEGARPPP